MIFFRTADPVADAERREMEWERFVNRRPYCRCCGQKITTQTAFAIEGWKFCPECIKESEFEFDDDDDGIDYGYQE